LLYENEENPDSFNRDSIAKFFTNAVEYIGNEDIGDIRLTTAELIKQGLKMKDAAHLACAIKANCDYFITTDDKLIKKYLGNKIKVRTLITFLSDLEEK
jgi:predicted nucleic acid-binding protein